MSRINNNNSPTSGTPRQRLSLSFFFLALFLLTAYCLQLNATIRYVSKTGSSVPPFLTWETSADSIQKCINISVFGDTIYVANGVYEEQVVMIPGLSLIGAGVDSCVINTKNLVNTIGFVAVDVKDSCLLKGFQIIVYYNNDKGYGVNCHGNCKVTMNTILSAAAGFGFFNTEMSSPLLYKNNVQDVQMGSIIFDSSPIIRKNNIFTSRNSTATIIAGVYINCTSNNYHPIIDSNYIQTQNLGIGEGIRKSIGSRPTVNNNIIKLKNLGGVGIFLSSSDSAMVYNNLIIAEQGWQGISNNGTQYLLINNNFITGYLYSQQNTDYGISLGPYNKARNNTVTKVRQGVYTVGTQNLVYQYNDVWNTEIGYIGLIPDTTNLSVDPMIVNEDTTQGNLNFHLQKFSPLIDAGDPNILDKDSTRSDIGLYGGPYGENYIYVDIPPRTPINLTANIDSLIKLNWNKNTEADFSYYNVYRDTTFDFTIDSTKLIASVTDTFYYQSFPSNVETLYYKITAVDNQGNESNPSEQVYVVLVSVKNEWVPVNNYILYQNYPNPFNPSTKIGYKLKERGYVKLYVYDIKGELVSVLVNEVQEAGYYEVKFSAKGGSASGGNASILASGVYIYQIFVKGENDIPVFSDTKKMVYVK